MSENIAERVVYHYTSQDGLIGILKSKSLWASHVLFQNDSHEFLHGKDLFLEHIRAYFPKRFPNCPSDIANQIEDWIQFFNNPIFTVSFSEQRVSLNQYRSYAKSRSGFSVGINIDRLMAGLDIKFQHKFVRCLYEDSEKRDFVRNIIRNCLSEKNTTHEVDEDLVAFIAARIVTYSPVLKHESFREERE